MTTSKSLKTPGKASMVALLLVAGAFLTPNSASAESREIRVSFSYNKAAPAERIYSDFRRTAVRACKEDSLRPLSLRKAEAVCAAELMNKAVAKLGRADVAMLHQGRLQQIAAR